MKADFANRFTGAALIAAALMIWLGNVLLPVRTGTFFDPGVFAEIHGQFRFWIWIYRVHFFGLVTSVVALVALATTVADAPARVLLWPAVVVISAGTFIGALAEAFYYHHGAWGSIALAGKSPEAVQAFIDALRIDTEYVTCLTRFGRVFGGFGFVLLAWGLHYGRIVPTWLAIVPALAGLAAMSLTMGLPDSLSLYGPVFHVLCLWLLATGVVILRRGVHPHSDTAPTRN